MKKYILFRIIPIGLFFMLGSYSGQAQVAINTDGTSPHASAALDVKATDKGILIPRMTTTEREAIVSPATGLLVYQNDGTTGFYYYDGSSWNHIKDASSTVIELADLDDGIYDGASLYLGEGAGTNDDGTSNNNVGIGKEVLYTNTEGYYNTATGYQALYDNVSGDQNTANGAYALYNNTASRNTATGNKALYDNISGTGNTANGSSALIANTTGDYNTATGFRSLHANTSGGNNVANGVYALYSNITGNYNTAIGQNALYSNTTGSYNTATGKHTLHDNNGSYNTANGRDALRYNTTGSSNTGMGYGTLYYNISGGKNTALGRNALNENTTGNYNTAVGYFALSSGTAYSNASAVGYNAEPGASNTIRLGNSSVSTIGGYTDWTNVSDGRFKVDVAENVVGLDFVMKLRPVTYHLDMDAIARFNHTPDSLRLKESEALKTAELQSGFIAQEVEQVATELGYDFHGVDKPKNETSHYGLRYATFVVPMVKAMQEQQVTIHQLNNRIEILEAQLFTVDKLVIRLEKLEKTN